MEDVVEDVVEEAGVEESERRTEGALALTAALADGLLAAPAGVGTGVDVGGIRPALGTGP